MKMNDAGSPALASRSASRMFVPSAGSPTRGPLRSSSKCSVCLTIHGTAGCQACSSSASPVSAKTQLDLKFCRDHPARFDETSRRTVSPVVSVQMPAAPTDRLFYMTLLRAIGAVFSPRISTAEAMIMALQLYANIGVRVVVFDEIHNLLCGTFRDQRRIPTQLRYLSNELRVSVVCLGIETARDAISGDPQLARRFSLVELPAWDVDADFRALVATLLRHLPLRGPSVLGTDALQTVIRSTRGNTARVFQLFSDLAVAAIYSGQERITAEAIDAWRPSVYDRALAG